MKECFDEIQVEYADVTKNGDGDPCNKSRGPNRPALTPKVDRLGNLLVKWSSHFGVKPSSKSLFPPIKIISSLDKGSCVIVILDDLVDHNIASMASTLVGNFIGKRLNIDIVRSFTHKKWYLKGQVNVAAMKKASCLLISLAKRTCLTSYVKDLGL